MNTTTGNFGLSGVIGGFTVGHNWQFGKIVLGLEGDLSANGVSGSASQPNPNYTYTTENTWLVTARPRIGYSFGSVMPYVTGGLAVGDLRTASYDKTTGIVGSDFSRTELGWTGGTGLEAMLAPNWSVKAEYLYVRLGDARGPSSAGTPTTTSFNENIGRVGLNYKFGQPASAASQNSYASSSGKDSGKPISLSTLTGIELGGQISSYHYQEHVAANAQFMQENGVKFGGTATAIKAFDQGTFVGGDVRIAYSNNHYSSPGSGTQNNIPDYLGDARLLLGQDFLFRDAFAGDKDFSVSPYTGIGYRNLYNDLRGTSSLGSTGYWRYSQYLYLPVGITPRFRVTDSARISTNLEYDHLLQGWQTSGATPSSPKLTNGQYAGYGLRGSLMVEWASWSVGPFFNYWNISQSAQTVYSVYYEFEPHNQTLESGLQAHYRF